MRYADIDWNEMWTAERSRKTWRTKRNADWDQRAAGFARRNLGSSYAGEFISRMRLAPHLTVLDMGCGPGTLALPIARKVLSVTAVDFSTSMLEELNRQAAAQKITNVKTVASAWEDDWTAKGIGRHDIAIASRSLSVDNLAGALKKLDQWTTRAIYIADRVGGGPFDPNIYSAVGREFIAGPDYIFTLNILYTLGIHARVDFITIDRGRHYDSLDHAFDSCRWMLDPMTKEEDDLLREYLSRHLKNKGDGSWHLPSLKPAKWALIWWEKECESP